MSAVFFITYGNQLLGCYSRIEAETYHEGRIIAHEGTDGGKYAFFYEGQEELDRQIKEYSLREIPIHLFNQCSKIVVTFWDMCPLQTKGK
jgi:hypothetical protein